MEKNKAILIIMDGWAQGKVKDADAVANAKTPFVDSLYQQYPHSTLVTWGEEVGLPEGQMGNSEVGHLNIGAGRIVYQELQRINVAIREGELAQNPVLQETLQYAKSNDKALHLIGLVSDGGVHSHINHIKALVNIAISMGLSKVYLHAFTDGRDTDPKSGLGFLTDLQQHLDQHGGKIASVTGRYYAMDRDKRWERVKLAYDALTKGVGTKATDALAAVKASYEAGVTDEFIKPIILTDAAQQPVATLQEGDAVLCFNFRTDRCREITQVLTQQDFPEFEMHTIPLFYTTMTQYDKTYKGVHVIFENDNLNMTLGEVIALQGGKQIRIAETEKYPHVSFFFSGGREKEFEGERRLMAASPKVATYDLQPEMSAHEITAKIVAEINAESADFIALNFANADMVGHTGIWQAAIKAVETVDACVKEVVTASLNHGYTVFLTADHGNADFMVNADGTPNTAHTLNPVPFFIINKDFRGSIRPGKLGDIAPTILHFMGIPVPKEMTGTVLV
ncbi:phosphoglycerate mutase [Chitinophaga costaii]|uniref:2,3-bisphosphoglycerate-independent phosphoglycerate mutase n=1 Tax=Chitinophaga costaii TaxID=1335309 RepID=A0A1C4B4R1_9BACT|nr:2,3-bisphosphoglycerate-independent phosphoglycerate mutase [Chitinophaga costaii]PUZ26863.1 2,3-bisphosphoglycerate-independent phosphoglycerate mutase [Chitinophaga costaii]SCC01682.1 phosphoglycerate mutase [Chitinophaga costaii]